MLGIRGMHVAVQCAERSEEHTSELQSQSNLVCRLLLEKKKKRKRITIKVKYENSLKRARREYSGARIGSHQLYYADSRTTSRALAAHYAGSEQRAVLSD